MTLARSLLQLVAAVSLGAGTSAAWAVPAQAAPAPAAQLASPVLRVEGRSFVDAQGRTVLLRGVNVSGAAKLAPFIPFADASGRSDVSRLDPLPGWGLNVIRLLFIWEAYEPRPGERNAAYLEELARVAEAAWARGLFVIVDFHQDSFSPYVAAGCGSGFPRWTVPPFFRRGREGQGPRDCGVNWGMKGMSHPGMHWAFREFYENRRGVRDAFLSAWDRIAERMSSIPGVIGYDILNEPWGNERGHLARLHEDAVKVIRARHPSAIAFVTPHTLTVLGTIQTRLRKPRFGNFAYSPHFYDGAANTKMSWDPANAEQVLRRLSFLDATAREWNVPLFLGEFGAFAQTRNLEDFRETQYSALDTLLASSAQWAYTPEWTPERKDGWNQENLSIVDQSGNLRPVFRPRASALAVAGKILAQTESPTRLELSWEHRPELGRTEITIPRGVTRILTTGAALECQEIRKGLLSCGSEVAGTATVVLESPVE